MIDKQTSILNMKKTMQFSDKPAELLKVFKDFYQEIQIKQFEQVHRR